MTKEEMLRIYREHNKADFFKLGFIYRHELYSINLDEMPDNFFRVTSSSRDGGMQVRIYVPASDKAMLIACGATYEGPESLLNEQGLKNRGKAYEKYITEKYAHETWEADRVPFYVKGDCEIEGKQVQVKLDSATVTNEKILRNMLQKMGKAV